MRTDFSHTVLTIAVLVALPAAWVPAHVACSHHAGQDLMAVVVVEGLVDSHCDQSVAEGWVQTRCCGSNGLASLCCVGRESGPVLTGRSVEIPPVRVTQGAPAHAPGAPSVRSQSTTEPVPVSGDLPPPGRNRYLELSVLRL